jgi:hypothetical protein
MSESTSAPDWRAAAEELLSLNLADLDVSELERRADLISRLRAMAPAMQKDCNKKCGTWTCTTF